MTDMETRTSAGIKSVVSNRHTVGQSASVALIITHTIKPAGEKRYEDWLFVLVGFFLLLVMGCSTVGGQVQAGRNALQTGRPEDAVGHLTPAAELDPHYRVPYRVPAGVLGYLGRAYLETGRPAEARRLLEQATKTGGDDPFVPLYLGVALVQTGETEQGRKEIEAGLRAIDDTLEYIAEDRVYGFFWDPAMAIRNDIRQTLAAKLDDTQLISAAQRIGRGFDREIDQARRDESRRRGGGEGGGGN
jgi:tetratricopeptide (TPR) repeat protein